MNGKRILITGASGGIGSSIVKSFAEPGNHLIIQGRNEDRLQALKQELEAKNITTDLWVDDFCDLEHSFSEARLKQLKQIDIFIHAAGHSLYKLLVETSTQEWDQLFNVHIKSAFRISKEILPYMVTQKWGRIILISSIWGESGASCEVAYSAVKGAMNAYTKALGKELAPSGITVNAIAPGVIDTNMITEQFDEEEVRFLVEQIPTGRLGRPAEVASLVKYLGSDESAYLTGQIIQVNGGWT